MAWAPKPEHVLQASVASFFRAHLPADMPWGSVDHGITFKGDRLQASNEWRRLAARGVRKGMHDMPVIFYRGHLHSIELKAPGGKLEPEQEAWGAKVVAQGGTWDVCETRAEVWASMCRAFPLDNPLKPLPGLLSLWLAHDDAPATVRKAKPKRAAKPRTPKPTRSAIARGIRLSLVGVRSGA